MSNSSDSSCIHPKSDRSASIPTLSKSAQEVLALREMLSLVLPMTRAPRTVGEMAILRCASRLCEGPRMGDAGRVTLLLGSIDEARGVLRAV